jgi:hypothetical protein
LTIQWKTGFEFELLAPPGCTRLDLAEAIATKLNGTVESFFHQDAEPSKVPGKKLFYNLTPGFAVLDAQGNKRCHVVDDITLRRDCDRAAQPKPGWYRILSDEIRLLRLVARHTNPTTPIESTLDTLGELFGSKPLLGDQGMVRLADSFGAPIAIAAPLPGERERPCELVTAPISEGHEDELTLFLETASELGFVLPWEGATHIHFDGQALTNTHTIHHLAQLLQPYCLLLRRVLQTNPACQRLNPWPKDVVDRILDPTFTTQPWPVACGQLAPHVKKYRDYNIANLILPRKDKHTFEVRTLPATLDATFILQTTRLFEAVLQRATDTTPIQIDPPDTLDTQEWAAWLDILPLTDAERDFWWDKRTNISPVPAVKL